MNKIKKRKEIIPTHINLLNDDIKLFFSNRSEFHKVDVPRFYVYIYDKAWEAFIIHGNNVYKEYKHEAQGIFIGLYCKDEYGDFVVALSYLEGSGLSKHSYVEMSDECLLNIFNNCQKNNMLMLIWAHTHPGFGTFYSSIDRNCLKTNFSKIYQIGIVVDNLKKKLLGYKVYGSEVIEYCDYALYSYGSKDLSVPFEKFEYDKLMFDICVKQTSNNEKELSDHIKDLIEESILLLRKIINIIICKS